MSHLVRVTSIEAIAEFKLAMRQFAAEVREALTTLQLESARSINWIESDRTIYWKMQVRKASERLNEARNNLERAQLSVRTGDRSSCYQEKKELAMAQQRLRFSESQVQVVRKWRQKLHHDTEKFKSKIGRMDQMVDVDLVRAVAALERIIAALDKYAERSGSHQADKSLPSVTNLRSPRDKLDRARQTQMEDDSKGTTG